MNSTYLLSWIQGTRCPGTPSMQETAQSICMFSYVASMWGQGFILYLSGFPFFKSMSWWLKLFYLLTFWLLSWVIFFIPLRWTVMACSTWQFMVKFFSLHLCLPLFSFPKSTPMSLTAGRTQRSNGSCWKCPRRRSTADCRKPHRAMQR